jgi:hypothetical protein
MNSDVSPTQVVSVVNTISGGKFIVSDKTTLATTLATGQIASLGGTGNCSGTTLGEPVVLWDRRAEGYTNGGRWFIAEIGAVDTSFCVYLSNTSDATGPWNAFEFVFPIPLAYPKVGAWPRLYAMTTLTQICVIDKLAIWADAVAPGLMCEFTDRTWTPVNTESQIVPPLTEGFINATLPGVIFMSLTDDEEDDTAPPSPTQDYLNVQNWYLVNFTGVPYPYRTTTYQLPVADFNIQRQEPILAPAGVEFPSLAGFISNRLVYRYMDNVTIDEGAAVPQSIVGCFTSYLADRVGPTFIRWFELRLYKLDENAQAQFHVYQDGAVESTDGLYQWIPTSTIDGYGTIVVGFSVSNLTYFPRLAATSQLFNDPINSIRQMSIVASPSSEVPVTTSSTWGSYGSISVLDPNRFYMSGQVAAASEWTATTFRLSAQSEVYNRTFIASYYACLSITAACSQTITAVG